MGKKIKILRKTRKIAIAGGMIFFAAFGIKSQDTAKLPTTEILGQQYYIYETQKGESLYGIAYKFGWDIEELARLNPESTSNLRKGRRLYYPVKEQTQTNISEQPNESTPEEINLISEEISVSPDSEDLPVVHKVKRGESVYGISRQYGISLDEIYASNPNAKHGVRAGDQLIIPQSETAKYKFYTVKSGDSLASVAKQFNTGIDDILKDNPGLSDKNFAEGETLRITPNTVEPNKKVVTEVIAEERVKEITDYKVDKNDTWHTISEKTGVDEELLKEVNSDADNLKKNLVINIPKLETIEVEKQYEIEDEEEITEEKIQEIYDSIHGVKSSEVLLDEVKVALLLDDPNSKRDIDFTRGMMVALSENQHPEFKVNLKVIDGRVATNELLDTIEDYEPNLIISTADKAFPAFLADYGNENHAAILNVFDLKNDLYEDNTSLVQLLLPSTYFSQHIADYIFDNHGDKIFLMIGEPDNSDAVGKELAVHYGENKETVATDKLKDFVSSSKSDYLIYPAATKKEEITDFFKDMETVAKNNPYASFQIVGRSNWAAMIDQFRDDYKNYNVIIPARVWLDEDSEQWKKFCNQYSELFDGTPVRSIPNYAASGYDVASYFLPLTAENGGDFNLSVGTPDVVGLQSDVALERVNNWGGSINKSAYILKFKNSGEIEKILIK